MRVRSFRQQSNNDNNNNNNDNDSDCRICCALLRFISMTISMSVSMSRVATMGVLVMIWLTTVVVVVHWNNIPPLPLVTGEHDSPNYNYPTSTIQQQQQYAIPRILIFTHYKNLLIEDESKLDNEEERSLAENVRHSIQVHHHDTTTVTYTSTSTTSPQSP
jgi:hypothetical protein